ncbi:MAG: MBL fold metallo-hydrolase [Poseidonibacter sp.]|uniref:MBL fold metallo-hydrolase n=1 Tax=Poseidonibacter sp. TaxID=2321188 RepID=UPI00359DEB7E
MAFYSSHGAAAEVTGSCHLLEIGHIKILIDCGLFQGKEEELNYEDFGFDPKEINYLIVTHAHLDHIGRIPLLVKNGFDKKIITTKATYEIAKLMLKNATTILQEKNKILYNYADLNNTLELFGTFLEYDETIKIEENIKISFKNAGHILGSTSVNIDYKEDGLEKSVVFSGDIGQKPRLITSKVDFWSKANYVFLESTYGNREHQELQLCVDDFKKKVLDTLNNNAVVLLPSFALERTQEILYILKQMSDDNLLEDVPVYLDSPLAINITKTFAHFPELFNEEIKELFKNNIDPFSFKELITTYSRDESIEINKKEGKKIIIAGSGMCEGGRIPYHLSRYIQDKRNMILFVGYQVSGTLGRKILNKVSQITIDKSKIVIKANIEVIDGFSAHADQNGLIDFIKDLKDVFCIYLIHGEKSVLEDFKNKITKELEDKVHIVKMKEKIYI